MLAALVLSAGMLSTPVVPAAPGDALTLDTSPRAAPAAAPAATHNPAPRDPRRPPQPGPKAFPPAGMPRSPGGPAAIAVLLAAVAAIRFRLRKSLTYGRVPAAAMSAYRFGRFAAAPGARPRPTLVNSAPARALAQSRVFAWVRSPIVQGLGRVGGGVLGGVSFVAGSRGLIGRGNPVDAVAADPVGWSNDLAEAAAGAGAVVAMVAASPAVAAAGAAAAGIGGTVWAGTELWQRRDDLDEVADTAWDKVTGGVADAWDAGARGLRTLARDGRSLLRSWLGW